MDTSLHLDDDRKAKIIAFIFAILLLFLILYPFWSYTFPPPEKAGILVSFGEVEVVGGDDVLQSQKEEVKATDTGVKEETKSEISEKAEPTEKKSTPQKKVVESKIVKEEKSVVEVQEEVVPKGPTAEELKKIAEAKQAAAEAKKQEEYERTKKQFGDLLGKGKGKAAESGNAGNPDGSPNSDVLQGIAKGKGKIQGGLSDRGLIYEPEINENSQKAGIVVVKVCVDQQGKVKEANYTQRGSTTTDSDLVKAAIDGAKKYQFSKSPIDRQCGTIIIEFKLK